MPNRSYSAQGGYRYGFNGQEKDNEISGEGNSYGATYWEYDSRIGRRWNVDPIYKHSPYSVFGNNPIAFTDPMGMDTVKNWQDAKTGDVWGHESGSSTFWYTWTGKKWESSGTTNNASMAEVIVKTSRKDPAVMKKMFAVAFTSFIRNPEVITGLDKLLEGTGVRWAEGGLSKFRFLGPGIAVASLVTLRGNNVTYHDYVEWNDNALNHKLQEGDLRGFEEKVQEWNERHKNDRLVFRYMSAAEFNGRVVPEYELSYAPASDAKGNPSLKYISPDIYFFTKSAKTLLALPNAPDVVIWTYESEILATKMPRPPGQYTTVDPKYGEPGGGNEATIGQPFPIHGFFPLIKK